MTLYYYVHISSLLLGITRSGEMPIRRGGPSTFIGNQHIMHQQLLLVEIHIVGQVLGLMVGLD